MTMPDVIETEAVLDDIMSAPTAQLVEFMSSLKGDVMILGIAGKMGIALGMAAVRACREAGVDKKIIGVSRFSDPAAREKVEAAGLETISCDLLDRFAVDRLPRVPNVIYMAGRKFGTAGAEALTWAANAVIPANVGHHFTDSRIVVFSSGNVYPLTPVTSGGAQETDAVGPIGEYAQSCIGRERVFSYFSQENETPMLLFRLNYAIDLRYGVLYDIGQSVFNDQSVSVNNGCFNCIWQGDANIQAILSLGQCTTPPNILNITGPETVSVRRVAEMFGTIWDKPVTYSGEEATSALIGNAKKAIDLFGYPTVSLERMIRWTAHWIKIGGAALGKPTHFEVRSGKY
jgi:nucleoside-diphosphate-sugar epimerase